MKVFFDLDSLPKFNESIVSIGAFDGVHLGHQAILKKLVNSDLESIVLTFWPNPKEYFHSQIKFCYLNLLQEKINLFKKQEIDNLVILKFDEQIRSLEYADFVDKILLKKLKAKKVVIGHDFRFGKDRKGDVDKLKEIAEKKNFEVGILSEQELNGVDIRSGNIRDLILNANIIEANKLLGYNYFINAEVGNKAEGILIVKKEKLIPKLKTKYKVKITTSTELEFEVADFEILQVIPKSKDKELKINQNLEFEGDIRIEFLS